MSSPSPASALEEDSVEDKGVVTPPVDQEVGPTGVSSDNADTEPAVDVPPELPAPDQDTAVDASEPETNSAVVKADEQVDEMPDSSQQPAADESTSEPPATDDTGSQNQGAKEPSLTAASDEADALPTAHDSLVAKEDTAAAGANDEEKPDTSTDTNSAMSGGTTAGSNDTPTKPVDDGQSQDSGVQAQTQEVTVHNQDDTTEEAQKDQPKEQLQAADAKDVEPEAKKVEPEVKDVEPEVAPAKRSAKQGEAERKRMEALARAVRTNANPAAQLAGLLPWVRGTLAVLEDGAELDKTLHYCLTVIVPTVVRWSLTCQPLARMVPEITDFLKVSCELVIKGIEYDVPEIVGALQYIFGGPIYERVGKGAQAISQEVESIYQQFGMPKVLDKPSGDVEYMWREVLKKRNEEVNGDQAVDDAPDAKSADEVEDSTSWKNDFPYAGLSTRGRKASYHLVSNINHFGKLGGFDAIITRIKKNDPSMPVTMLPLLLQALVEARHVLNRDFLAEYSPELVAAVTTYFTTLDHEVTKNLSRNAVLKPIQQVDLLLSSFMDKEDVKAVTEKFELEYSFSLLATPYLEKRIQGINEIKETIEITRKKEDYLRKQKSTMAYLQAVVRNNEPVPVYTKRWMSTDYIAKWMVDKKLIDVLLDPDNTHLELIRRAYEPMLLLQEKDLLTSRNLDMLWRLACLGMHESTEHLVFDITCSLSKHLSLPQLRHLFRQIQQKKFAEYDTQMVTLIKDFTRNAFRRYESAKAQNVEFWFGLDLFWALALQNGRNDQESKLLVPPSSSAGSDPSVAPEWIASSAVDLFLELLGEDIAQVQRPEYMKKCIDYIHQGRFVPQMLNMLMSIIRTYPQGSKGWFGRGGATVWSVIEDLEQRYNVLDLVLSELQKFLKRMGRRIQRCASDEERTECASVQAQGIELRQQFLVFLLSESSLMLEASQADKIWDSLVLRGSERERNSCLRWLIEACGPLRSVKGDQAFSAMTEATKRHLFQKRILKMEPTGLSKTGFRLLRHFFLHISEKAGGIRIEKTYKPAPPSIDPVADDSAVPGSSGAEAEALSLAVRYSRISVSRPSEIQGQELLWDIVLKGDNKDVALAATDLLVAINQNFHSKVKATEQSTIRDKFLRSCLTHLSNALKKDNQLVVQRSVHMLRCYLSGFQSKRSRSQLQVTIALDAQFRVPPFDLQLMPTTTVVGLKRTILSHLSLHSLGLSVTLLSLSHRGRNLTVSNATLRNLGVLSGDTIRGGSLATVFRRKVSPLAAVLQPLRATYPFPNLHQHSFSHFAEEKKLGSNSKVSVQFAEPSLAIIAEDNEIFSRLFTLLTPGSPVGQEVWDILMLLPKNKAMMSKFEKLEEATYNNWPKLFDTKSGALYKLLYGLQIIHSFLSSSGSGNRTWCSEFVHWGGVQYICKLLTDGQLGSYSEMHGPRKVYLETVMLLVKTINNFMALDPMFPVVSSDLPSSLAGQLPKGVITSAADFASMSRGVLLKAILPMCCYVAKFLEDIPPNSGVDVSDLENVQGQLLAACSRLAVGLMRSQPSLVVDVMEHRLTTEWLNAILVVPRLTSSRLDAANALYELSTLVIPSLKGRGDDQEDKKQDEPPEEKQADKAAQEEEQKDQATSSQALTKQPEAGTWILKELVHIVLQRPSPPPQSFKQNSSELFLLAGELLLDQLSEVPSRRRHSFTKESGILAQAKKEFATKQVTSRPGGALASLLAELAEAMKKRLAIEESIERFAHLENLDYEWIGMLRLFRYLTRLRVLSDGLSLLLVDVLYDRCLFDVPKLGNPLGCQCKANISRNEAQALLIDMCLEYPDCHAKVVSRVLDDPMWGKPRRMWSYHPANMERAKDSFVGLKNQGATCYMNSLIQQLYNVPKFREAVLSVRQSGLSGKEKKSTLVHQLQLMFGFLKLSKKKFYDTLPFCKSITVFNEPLQLSEQKDVNEFAGILFDSLETGLKNTPQSSLLEQTFRGKLMHQVLSFDCEHTSEREENFFMISLTVKNKRNLTEALDLFVEGDRLDGDNKYMCGNCSDKVAAIKRVCLHSLPRLLILHLKRFEFDFDTFRKIKVNDKFEFPMELDLRNYSREGLAQAEIDKTGSSRIQVDMVEDDEKKHQDQVAFKPENYYKYRLVGVLVHSGMADAGHYYSFVSNSLAKGQAGGDDSGWTEFNDITVKPFDPKDIPDQCFGGREMKEQYDAKKGAKVMKEVDKIRNAYLLLYERVAHVPEFDITETKDDAEDKKDEEDKAAGTSDTEDAASAAEDAPVAAAVGQEDVKANAADDEDDSDDGSYVLLREQAPKQTENLDRDILKSIWSDNSEFFHDRNIFSFSYLNFLWTLSHLAVGDDSASVGIDDDDDDSNALLGKQDLVQRQQDPEELVCKSVQIAALYVFEILARSTDNSTFPYWLAFLRTAFGKSPAARAWFLDKVATNGQWTDTLLFKCPHGVVRSAFVETLLHVVDLQRADTNELVSLSAVEKKDDTDTKTPVIANLMKAMLARLSSVKRHYKTYMQYFQFLHDFACMGRAEREFLVSERAIYRLLMFYLDREPYTHFNFRPSGYADRPPVRIHPPNVRNFMKVLTLLVTSCTTYSIVQHPVTGVNLLEMKESEADLLMLEVDPDVPVDKGKPQEGPLPFILKDSKYTKEVIDIAVHWCTEDPKLSSSFIDIALNGVLQEFKRSQQFRPYFRLASAILLIEDKFTEQRVRRGLAKLVRLIKRVVNRAGVGDERFLFFAIKYLLYLTARSDVVKKALDKSDAEWESWMDTFKANHQGQFS